jgi:hypothetical protein
MKWSQVSALGAALALVGGCGGGGGGSGSSTSSGGIAAQNPDPVVISSVQTGLPICSTVGNGSLNGPTTPGTTATVTVSPSCSDPSATMRVWLGLNSADTNITHYDWEIVGWKNAAPHGGLDKYDAVVDVDPVHGRYIVRTYGVNSIRYTSATSAQLAGLTTPFTQQISVTAWTADGRFGSASFTIVVQPGGTAVSAVYGSLAATDAPSHGRAGHRADFYRLTGTGTTTLSAEGFDTCLYVYNSALGLVGEKDEGGSNGGSQLTLNLQNGQTYYVEVTSFQAGQTGNYRVSSSAGGLMATADPWAGVTVPNLAGTYSVTENTTITMVYKGITTTTNAVGTRTVTLTQSGPSFSFQASDPTGMLPSMTRYGNITGNSLQLTGDPFLPGNPAIQVTSTSQTSSGTWGGSQLIITNTAQLQGTYNGLPLTAQLNSRATFTR